MHAGVDAFTNCVSDIAFTLCMFRTIAYFYADPISNDSWVRLDPGDPLPNTIPVFGKTPQNQFLMLIFCSM